MSKIMAGPGPTVTDRAAQSLADLSEDIDRTVADDAPEENLLGEQPQRLVGRARLDLGLARVRPFLARCQGLPRAGVKDSRHERFDTEDRDDHDDRHNNPGPGAGRHRAVSGSGTMPLRPAAPSRVRRLDIASWARRRLGVSQQ